MIKKFISFGYLKIFKKDSYSLKSRKFENNISFNNIEQIFKEAMNALLSKLNTLKII